MIIGINKRVDGHTEVCPYIDIDKSVIYICFIRGNDIYVGAQFIVPILLLSLLLKSHLSLIFIIYPYGRNKNVAFKK